MFHVKHRFGGFGKININIVRKERDYRLGITCGVTKFLGGETGQITRMYFAMRDTYL